MARDALPSSFQLATAVPPPAQAVQDYDFIPEGAAGINGSHVADRKIKVRKIVRDVRPDDNRSMRVERGLRARFDLDGATDVSISFGGAFWVFYSSLTDIQYTLTVVDQVTGDSKLYAASSAGGFCGGADTNAFRP